MNKEGWAPAVYLKRVSVATGNSPTSLRRLSAMGMHLRDETRDFEEMLNTEGQDGGASRKYSCVKASSITTSYSVVHVTTRQNF